MNDLREVVKLLDVSLALELGDDALQVADIRLSGQYGVNICSVCLAVQRVGNALLVRLGLQCFVHLLNVGLLLKLDQDVLEVLAWHGVCHSLGEFVLELFEPGVEVG